MDSVQKPCNAVEKVKFAVQDEISCSTGGIRNIELAHPGFRQRYQRRMASTMESGTTVPRPAVEPVDVEVKCGGSRTSSTGMDGTLSHGY